MELLVETNEMIVEDVTDLAELDRYRRRMLGSRCPFDRRLRCVAVNTLGAKLESGQRILQYCYLGVG